MFALMIYFVVGSAFVGSDFWSQFEVFVYMWALWSFLALLAISYLEKGRMNRAGVGAPAGKFPAGACFCKFYSPSRRFANWK